MEEETPGPSRPLNGVHKARIQCPLHAILVFCELQASVPCCPARVPYRDYPERVRFLTEGKGS